MYLWCWYLLTGVGSVLTASGHHELEASVMTDDGRCGAVALVKRIENPVRLAQQVRNHVSSSSAPQNSLS